MGLPLLCNVMLLRNSNLETFLSRFPPANCVLISSLTVAITPEKPAIQATAHYVEAKDHMIENGSQITKTLWDRLQRLVTFISKMTNLLSFCFTVTIESRRSVGFWIPRSVIASMVENVSKSCVSLEIDTRGYDSLEPDSAHLCDKLRDVLPRLRHLRVRLATFCPAMFCANKSANDTIDDQTIAPSLETVIINCVTRLSGYGGPARACGFPGELQWWGDYHNHIEARVFLATTLRDLVVRGKFPKIERLWLVDMQYDGHDDRSVYLAYNRRDILLNKTWVIPIRGIVNEQDSFLIRTPELHEVLSFQWAVEELVEAQTWKETLGGYRIPAAMIGIGCFQREDCWEKPLPLMSVEDYKIRYPRKSCLLWGNERKTGLRLLYAFERQGILDTSLVKGITPSGWIRYDDELEPAS